MSLRLRRGPSEDRVTLVFQAGELVYDTVEQRLYVGDGLTQGGLPITDLLGDASPQLGSDLDLNGNNIIGFGNINIDGDITATGTLTIPNIITDVTGSIFGDDSTPLVDGANSKLVLENNNLSDLGNVTAENPNNEDVLKYSTTAGAWQSTNTIVTNISSPNGQILVSIDAENVYLGNNSVADLKDVNYPGIIYPGDVLKWDSPTNKWIPGPIFPNNTLSIENLAVTQTATVNNVSANAITTDILDVGATIHTQFLEAIHVDASIISVDSATLIDNVTSTGYIDIVGDVIGDVTGDVTGNVTGNVSGNLLGDVTGNLVGDVTGNVNGNLVGDAELGLLTVKTELTCEAEATGEFNAFITGNDNNSVLRLSRKFVITAETDTTRLGVIRFCTIDNADAITTHGQIDGRKGYIWLSSSLAADYVDTTNTAHLFLDGANGCIGIGKRSASFKLDVDGEIVSTSYVQFGSLTTTERNNLTAVNGMVIYNTTNNKFEGYQNGTWINIDDGQPAT